MAIFITYFEVISSSFFSSMSLPNQAVMTTPALYLPCNAHSTLIMYMMEHEVQSGCVIGCQ